MDVTSLNRCAYPPASLMLKPTLSRTKFPIHKFITRTFTISFNWGRLHPDKGIPGGTFILSCCFFQTHIAMTSGVLLQNRSCPPCRHAPVPTISKTEAIVTGPYQGGSGASVRVSVGYRFRLLRPANSRILPPVITAACCKGDRLGIGHTRLPMKEHLGQPQIVTVLRGRPGNYCHIKAIVRALL